MGIFSIIMMIIDLITGIPKIIALIDAIIELMHVLHPDEKKQVLHRFKEASEMLRHDHDKAKYAQELGNIVSQYKKP